MGKTPIFLPDDVQFLAILIYSFPSIGLKKHLFPEAGFFKD